MINISTDLYLSSTIFVDVIKQSPEVSQPSIYLSISVHPIYISIYQAAVSMLDSEHENPELIWNEDTRAKVARVIGEEASRLHQVHSGVGGKNILVKQL